MARALEYYVEGEGGNGREEGVWMGWERRRSGDGVGEGRDWQSE